MLIFKLSEGVEVPDPGVEASSETSALTSSRDSQSLPIVPGRLNTPKGGMNDSPPPACAPKILDWSFLAADIAEVSV